MHSVGEQAVIVGLVVKGLEEVGGGRAERAVGIRLESAESQVRSAEGVADADFGLIVHLRDEGRGIDAGRQLAFTEQLGIDGDVGVVRIHILHAGDTERRGVPRGPFDGVAALGVSRLWDNFEYEIGGGIHQCASGTALRVVDDHAPVRVGSLRRDASRLQRQRVDQNHVSVVTANRHGRSGSHRINQLFGGELRRAPFCFVPVAAEEPLAFRSLRGALRDAASKFLRAGGVVQLYVVELRAARHEVDVGIVETGQEAVPCCVDRLRIGSPPGIDILIGAHGDDSIAQDCNGFRLGVVAIHGPDSCVADDEVGGGLGLGESAHRARQKDCDPQGIPLHWYWFLPHDFSHGLFTMSALCVTVPPTSTSC